MFLALPSSTALSFGCSKLFQILIPLGAYILLQESPVLRRGIGLMLQILRPQAPLETSEYLVNLLVGFMSWKVGCDLGFLLISTGAAPWSIAFTIAGLIPYTIIQYVFYYLVGQKILIQGYLNPFQDDFVIRRISGRPPLWQQVISKFFHESMNATSANVPMRQVVLKPFIDYGGIVASWSFYNVGLLFVQSGEVNLDPLIHFQFISILVFYIVNVFGYILGYNLGEFLYFRIRYLWEGLQLAPTIVPPGLQPWLNRWGFWCQQQRRCLQLVWIPWRPFLMRYGLSTRWLVASITGISFVILLQPSMSSSLFALSDRLAHYQFLTLGRVEGVHVQQVLTASREQPLPDPETLTATFPDLWRTIYPSKGEPS